jgi:chromosome segregation ATPase
MEQQDLSNDITQIKLDIREIMTLLRERAKSISDNAKNIGQAFTEIKAVAADLRRNDEETRRVVEREEAFEGRMDEKLGLLADQIERLRATLDDRFKKLETDFHSMSEVRFQVKLLWGLFASALTAAVLALVNFFKD